MDSDSEIVRTSFNFWGRKFEAYYDLFLAELEAKVAAMQAQGIPNNVIIKILNGQVDEESDIFGALMGKTEKYSDDISNAVAQSASNDFDMNEKLYWVLDPGAKHCDDCYQQSTMEPKTFAQWEIIGLPGAGNTECGVYCKCTLEPVQVEEPGLSKIKELV